MLVSGSRPWDWADSGFYYKADVVRSTLPTSRKIVVPLFTVRVINEGVTRKIFWIWCWDFTRQLPGCEFSSLLRGFMYPWQLPFHDTGIGSNPVSGCLTTENSSFSEWHYVDNPQIPSFGSIFSRSTFSSNVDSSVMKALSYICMLQAL